MHYLFVYGTLRRTADHAMHQVLKNQAEWVADGSVPGKLYLVDWYPALISTTQHEERVQGEVYLLANPEKTFFELDPYEGYYPDDEAHSDYLRQQETVQLSDGSSVTAWVYVYNLPIIGLSQITSGDFMKR
ncbi:gamma-glutamylcyclotransferase [Siphonobacter sp. SORGH_AS_1065]|uniref:gamma-glutamylcyclotransferase family protein n=1 Tax=Siphonobacter sp. SORGH_AS_1065 TaxID=3041795 RepID=UPI002785DE36|nr:gamma-glutamylcyclotransferase family protein [Siphonobacter sp. SORGH_AS_1065]MDQ1087643.1 gamma-glutamylcyclotransferase (GGCT)/AIG2-like uncharacterized protein YtfP [Siphonobacter sp. SORGH_AS_1065]